MTSYKTVICALFDLPQFESYMFFGLAYQGKDIVFRFIIKYISLKGFWLLCNRSIFIGGFLKDDILACVLET